MHWVSSYKCSGSSSQGLEFVHCSVFYSVDGRLGSVGPVHSKALPLGLESLEDGVTVCQSNHALQQHGLACNVLVRNSLARNCGELTLVKSNVVTAVFTEAVVVIESEGVRWRFVLGEELLKEHWQENDAETVRIQLGLDNINVTLFSEEIQPVRRGFESSRQTQQELTLASVVGVYRC